MVESIESTLLQNIIEQLPCHIYWMNRNNVYLGCNEAQAKDLGLQSKDKFIGRTNFDFHDTITAKKLDSINEFVMSTGKSYEVEENGYVLGEWKNCLTKKIALFDSLGKVVGLLGVSFDITAKKRLEELKIEELKNKIKAKEGLYKIAREVSHDIASPVSALKAIEYIYKDKLEAPDLKMLSSAIKSIEDMAGKMLTKYRAVNESIETGKKEVVDDKVEGEYISLDVILPDIVENMKYSNNEANIEINREYKGDRPVFIKGECGKFLRMMTNLIKNAIEAVEQGEKAKIEVSYAVK
ncbi:MAG: PAS domain-containing protein [Endomicrobium sp.]|nr:PAS domain-containing protein [Endomicrobium sp.]